MVTVVAAMPPSSSPSVGAASASDANNSFYFGVPVWSCTVLRCLCAWDAFGVASFLDKREIGCSCSRCDFVVLLSPSAQFTPHSPSNLSSPTSHAPFNSPSVFSRHHDGGSETTGEAACCDAQACAVIVRSPITCTRTVGPLILLRCSCCDVWACVLA